MKTVYKIYKTEIEKKSLINTSYLDTKNNFDTRRKKNENKIKEVSDFAKISNTLLNKKKLIDSKKSKHLLTKSDLTTALDDQNKIC